VPIVAAGGLEDGGLGTSFERIQQAVDAVYTDEGVLILMDLGSAVMTTQMVVEMLPPEQSANIRLSNAPFVEGAVAAAVASSLGNNLDRVQHAAETAMELPKRSTCRPLRDDGLPICLVHQYTECDSGSPTGGRQEHDAGSQPGHCPAGRAYPHCGSRR